MMTTTTWEPTTRQQKMLAFIEQFIADHQYGPSLREIVDATDFTSTSVVNWNLRTLENRGLIRRTPRIARSIRLVGEN